MSTSSASLRKGLVKRFWTVLFSVGVLLAIFWLLYNTSNGQEYVHSLEVLQRNDTVIMYDRADWSAKAFNKDFSLVVAITAAMIGGFALFPTMPVASAVCIAVLGISGIGAIVTNHREGVHNKRSEFLKSCEFSSVWNMTVCHYNLAALQKRGAGTIDYFNITGMADLVHSNGTVHRGIMFRQWDQAKSTVVGIQGIDAASIYDDMTRQANDGCHGGCHVKKNMSNSVGKRDVQYFDVDWVCYEYKEDTDSNNLGLQLDELNWETNGGRTPGSMPSILLDFYRNYPQWKTCVGINRGDINGDYREIPDGRLYRGEVYYNTCGGLDGQCGDDYEGADDHSSPYNY